MRHYRDISRIRQALADRLLAHPPQAFIGIDAPDFNLGLEERLKQQGIPSIHFVCPSIWAWRGGRAKRIARSTDHVLCLFPFEPEFFARLGVDVDDQGVELGGQRQSVVVADREDPGTRSGG